MVAGSGMPLQLDPFGTLAAQAFTAVASCCPHDGSIPVLSRSRAILLRDNQNHARCDNQASLTPVNVVQRRLHPIILLSGRQAVERPGLLGPRLWRLRA